jgi:hypothetical protein
VLLLLLLRPRLLLWLRLTWQGFYIRACTSRFNPGTLTVNEAKKVCIHAGMAFSVSGCCRCCQMLRLLQVLRVTVVQKMLQVLLALQILQVLLALQILQVLHCFLQL